MNLNIIHDVFIYACSEDLMEDQAPMKRHSDAIFTDNYSRFRKQMAVKKYLNSVLSGKRRYAFLCPRFWQIFYSKMWKYSETKMLNIFPDLFSQEDPPSMQEESTGGETTYRESYDDVTVDRLLNHIPFVR